MYQLEDSRNSQPAHPLWGVEPYSRELTDQKLAAMKNVLSPEQFEILKNHGESQLEATRLQNLGNQPNADGQ
jgi:hypothetical protein